MKGTLTLCQLLLLIFIICMCILLFCSLIAMFGVLSSCTSSFCMSFVSLSSSQGAVTCTTAISSIHIRNSGSELSSSSVDVHCRCTTELKNWFVLGLFSISAPSIQFQTRKFLIDLYCCTIRFKHLYHWAKTGIGFIMHWFIIIMKIHPCNQL